MSNAPEILISADRAVLQEFAKRETLVACWDASNDPAFAAAFAHVRAFNQSAQTAWQELQPVEAYAESIIDEDIDAIVRKSGRGLMGYNPLDTWVVADNDDISAGETVPHRDHECFGIFFYFNETGGLATHCVPKAFEGEPGERRSYPDADKSQAVVLPAQSVGLIKLGEMTHFGPSTIPEGACRVVMHARYDLY